MNLMNRPEIETLQSVRDYPSISIFLPVYHQSPSELEQTPVRVRNLLREAENRLLREFSEPEIEPLKDKWEELTQKLDYKSSCEGLALFISCRLAQAVKLPYPVPERVVVDETFATRDLVRAFNRSTQYRVLMLSREKARLYEGKSGQLAEVDNASFPVSRDLPGVEVEWTGSMPPGSPHGGIDPDQYREREERNFLHRVDDALAHVVTQAPLPLAVVGVDENISLFKEVSKHRDQIVAQLQGNFEKLPLHELEQRIWPLTEAALAENHERTLERLENAMGAQKYAAGVEDVWSAAQEGKIDTLLVEEDFRCPACTDDSWIKPVAAEYSDLSGVTDDAVDEIMETVMNKGGQVSFFGHGTLDKYGHIAAILRY